MWEIVYLWYLGILGIFADLEEVITFLRSFVKLLPNSFGVKGLLGLDLGLAPKLLYEGKMETFVPFVLLVFSHLGLLRSIFTESSLEQSQY